MACQIFRDTNNQITRVEASNGQPSILFQSIAQNPLIENQESALESYKNIFSKNLQLGNPHPIKRDVNGEPILFFKTPSGQVFNNYKEALDATEVGDIQGIVITTDNISYNQESHPDILVTNSGIEINSDEAYQELFSVNSNSNPDTLQGFINQQIRLGYLNDKNRLVNGLYELQGAGESIVNSIFNSELAYQNAVLQFGHENVQRYDTGIIEINYIKNDTYQYEGGEISQETFLQDLKSNKLASLERRMGESAVAAFAVETYREKNNILKRSRPVFKEPNALTEAQLINTVKNFLNKIGVTTTSIEDYIERYSDKNNISPDANALADIANRVVAFSQGQISIQDLTEETAHFAIEAFEDQETLTRMLQNVHLTNEWKNYIQQYTEVYSKKYSGVELDSILRREMLGKVLARKLQDSFIETDNTPVESGFTNLLLRLWSALIQKVRSLYTPSIQTELDNFTEAIANNILNNEFDDVFSTSQLSKSEFLFYSLSDKRVSSRLQKYYNSLEKINVQLKKSQTGNIDTPLNKSKEILNAEKELDKAEVWIVIQQLNAGLSAPLNKIIQVVDSAMNQYRNSDPNQNKLYLDGETIVGITSLLDAREAVQEVISLVENGIIEEIDQVDKNTILRDLTNKLNQINKLERDRDLLNIDGSLNVVEKIKSELNLPDSYTESIKNKIGQVTKDITIFGRWFGQPAFANNDWINLLSKIFANNTTKANIDSQRDSNDLIAYIADNNYGREKFNSLIEKDSKNQPTGYLISGRKIGEFEQDLEDVKVGFIKRALELPESESNTAALKKLGNLSQLQRQEYDRVVREWINDNTEREFTNEYYQRREDEMAFMSEDTKELLKNLSSSRFRVLNKYPKGAVISDADLAQLEFIARARKQAKSPIFEDGSLKEEGTVEWRISQDLIQADEQFAEKNKDKITTLKSEFVETLEALEGTVEGNKDSLRVVLSNGGYRYNKEFYDALGVKTSEDKTPKMSPVVRKLRDSIEDMSEEDASDVLELSENIQEKLDERSELLRMHQKVGNPAEVDVSVMSEISKERIKILDSEIQKAFQEANQKLRQNGLDEVTPPQVETENTVNQSYTDDLIDSGVKPSQFDNIEELDFIYENVSTTDRVEISKFIRKVQDIQTLTTTNIEPKYKRFFSNYFNINSELDSEEFFDEVRDKLMSDEFRPNLKVQVAYSKTKLYSYYKRFAPKGYSELLEDLQNGKIPPSSLINDRENLIKEYPAAQYVEITPNYTWVENNTENERNPNWVENWEGGYYQPKVSKYTNENYYQRFGINEGGQATRNTEDFRMLELFHEAKRKATDNFEIGDNIYKLPQISKSGVQKIADSLNVGVGETLKRSFKDVMINRIDDMDYGMQAENDSHNVIPVKYIYNLEERSDVSLDLGLTYTELLIESNKYKYRKTSLPSVMSIRQQIAEQKFTSGKTGENSFAIEMADSTINKNIYGVRQSRKLEVLVFGYKVDLARLATVLHKILQWGALSYNPVIALTNYFTGATNLNAIEARLGEFINPNSNLYSLKEFDTKELPKLVSESGQLVRTSKVYKLLEAGGIIDFRNRLQNSNLGRVGNLLSDAGWAMLRSGDIALKSRVFIATFDDMRAIPEVGFMTYNQYKLHPENQGLTKSQITEKWNEFRENSLWNSLVNEGGEPLRVEQKWVDMFGQEVVDNVLNNTLQKAAQTSAQIDGQVTESEKSAATQDYMLRYLTSMRSWLYSGLQNRLQNRKYDLLRGQEIEGSYISTSRYINNIVKKMIDDRGISNLIGIVQNEWDAMDEVEKRNTKRVMADFAVFLVLIGLSTLAFAGADDDDSYLYTMAAYTLYRVTSETGSQTVTGLGGNLVEVMDKPIMAVSFLKELYNNDFFSEIQTGKYQGQMRLFATFYRNTPIKQYYDLPNIQQTSDSYRQLNENLLFLSSDKSTEELIEYFKIN